MATCPRQNAILSHVGPTLTWHYHVVDHLDSNALKSYWRQAVEPLIAEAGPRAAKVLKAFQTNSWEAGGINRTANLPKEFRQRRGYDFPRKTGLPLVALVALLI